MESKKISVIIPVYNAEKHLDDILSDLISQTYKNMEIIIVNDGSSDGSMDIIEKYHRLDKRITTISVENHGPSSARNIGLRNATGEFVRFIDADDRIPKDSMEKMLEPFLKYEDIDLVIGNYRCIPDKGYFTGSKIRSREINKEELVELFLGYIKTFYFGVPWNKLFRKSIIQEYSISFNEKIMWCEDFLFNIEYFKKTNKAYLLNTKCGVYQYYIREDGITCNLKNRKWEELQKIDELRYCAAKEYCCQYISEDIFSLQWDNAELYKKLCIITKYNSDKIGIRYKKFKEYLQGKDVHKYILIKCNQSNAYEWNMIKKSFEKKKYFGAFIFFSVKGFLSRHFTSIERIIRDENATCE